MIVGHCPGCCSTASKQAVVLARDADGAGLHVLDTCRALPAKPSLFVPSPGRQRTFPFAAGPAATTSPSSRGQVGTCRVPTGRQDETLVEAIGYHGHSVIHRCRTSRPLVWLVYAECGCAVPRWWPLNSLTCWSRSEIFLRAAKPGQAQRTPSARPPAICYGVLAGWCFRLSREISLIVRLVTPNKKNIQSTAAARFLDES